MLNFPELNQIVNYARTLGLPCHFNQHLGWKISYYSQREAWTLIQSGAMWLLLTGDEPQFCLSEMETIQFMKFTIDVPSSLGTVDGA